MLFYNLTYLKPGLHFSGDDNQTDTYEGLIPLLLFLAPSRPISNYVHLSRLSTVKPDHALSKAALLLLRLSRAIELCITSSGANSVVCVN